VHDPAFVDPLAQGGWRIDLPVTVVAAVPVTSPLAGYGVSFTGLLRHIRKRGHVTAVEGRRPA
jgi:hypothetical protein